MLCRECGAELAADAKFCQACGTPAGQGKGDVDATASERFRQAARSRQSDDDEQEEEHWHGDYSKLAMVGAWIGAGVLTLVLLVAGALLITGSTGWMILGGLLLLLWLGLVLRLLYRQMSVHYTLTDQRFLHESGLLWRKINRIELIDVDDVSFQQGPIERLVDVGTVTIASSDLTHPQLSLPGIERPREVAGMIDDLRRKERRRRGLHIESV